MIVTNEECQLLCVESQHIRRLYQVREGVGKGDGGMVYHCDGDGGIVA